jgi:flavin-dependent dehydrogenase
VTHAACWSGDVIVVGGGPAGSACATFLARARLQVLLVDRSVSDRWQPVEVLAPGTVQLLRHHRLFEADAARGYGVCRGVHGLWGREPAFLDYQLFACDAGTAVDRVVFDRELLAGATAAGAHIVTETLVERALQSPDGDWIVSLVAADGRKTTARAALVVEAGGRAARSLAPSTAERSYVDRLIGIACRLTLEPSPIQIMLLEADVDGWWYSSCDGRGHGAAVYLSDADLVPRTPHERASFFRSKFASSRLVRQHLPALPDVPDLHVIDARTSRRTHFCSPASLAIGDAAYGVDPLSGSGIRRAVESARTASIAADAFLAARDARALASYSEWAAAEFDKWRRDKNDVYAEARPELHGHPFWKRRLTACPA